MKHTTLIASVLLNAAVLVVGCQSEKRESGNTAAVPSEVATASSNAPAPASEQVNSSPPASDQAKSNTPASAQSAPPPTVATTSVSTNVLPAPIRINAGAYSAFTNSAGDVWLPDTGFSGGDVVERPGLEIANTPEPAIYRSEHYGMDSFAHRIPNGKYQVKLHFCETFEGILGPRERVFSFKVEDKEFKDFDVWVKAGGWGKAYVETVDVDIADGQLDVAFIHQVEFPEINGIEIIPMTPE